MGVFFVPEFKKLSGGFNIMTNNKRIALYIRVSTTEQAMEGYSISEQKDRLHQYSSAMGWLVVDEYIDPGYSGSNVDRPGLKTLIENIGQYDTVLVYKLDRLSRSQKDTMYLIEDVFIKNGVSFVSMNESFDTGTPFGRAAIGLLATFAQLERENIKERMAMGMKGRIRKGYWKGTSRPPIGYDYQDNELVINDYEALQIRELFSIVINGVPGMEYNIKNMARYLAKKYSNKYGSWQDASGIKRIIRNNIYLGIVKYNDECYQGVHKPLIDQDTFDKANAKLNAYLATFDEHVSYTKYMLSGITFCGICNQPYYRRNSQVKGKDSKKEYGYYSCMGRRGIADGTHKCESKIFKQDELEDIVVQQIIDLVYRDWTTGEKKNNDRNFQHELKNIAARQERLIDLYMVGSISKEMIDDKMRELNREREKINSLISQEENSISSELIIDIASRIESSDYAAKVDMVRMLVDKVVIKEEKVRIYWRF